MQHSHIWTTFPAPLRLMQPKDCQWLAAPHALMAAWWHGRIALAGKTSSWTAGLCQNSDEATSLQNPSNSSQVYCVVLIFWKPEENVQIVHRTLPYTWRLLHLLPHLPLIFLQPSQFPPRHPKEAATWSAIIPSAQNAEGIFPAETAFKWVGHSQEGHIIRRNPHRQKLVSIHRRINVLKTKGNNP